MKKKSYVISYDITDDRRRAKAADTLKNYGQRVQKSVFECCLNPEKLVELTGILSAIIDRKTDSVLIWPLCEICVKQRTGIGQNRPLSEEEFCVI